MFYSKIQLGMKIFTYTFTLFLLASCKNTVVNTVETQEKNTSTQTMKSFK